jgi:hypothetical protein
LYGIHRYHRNVKEVSVGLSAATDAAEFFYFSVSFATASDERGRERLKSTGWKVLPEARHLEKMRNARSSDKLTRTNQFVAGPCRR